MTATDWTSTMVDVGGASLCGWRRRGDGAALVLVPGSFYDRTQWDAVIAGLSPKLDLLIVELAGHGRSRPPLEDGSLELLTRDVLRVVDHVGLERYYIGGHSIGGMIAIEACAQRSDGIIGVVSIEGWTNNRVPADAFAGEMQNTLTPEQLAWRAATIARVTGRWSRAQFDAFATIWTRWDGYDILCRTDRPVLEVWGDRGRAAPSREAMAIPDRPNIELKWIHGASHELPMERPAEVSGAIMGFIDANERVSAAG